MSTLSSTHDTVIVTPHWGQEFAEPSTICTVQALAWLEAGATAVIGNHPHVTGRMEEYTTSNGRRTVIAYSLGNFISHMGYMAYKRNMKFYPRLRTSPFLLLKLRKTLKGSTVLDSVRYVPLFVRRTSPKPCEGCKCPKPFGETILRQKQSCHRYHVMPADKSSSDIGQQSWQIIRSVLGPEKCLDYDQAMEWVKETA